MNANLIAPLFVIAIAALVVGLPLFGQLLPLEWRSRALSPRAKALLNGVAQMAVGVMVSVNNGNTLMAHGADAWTIFFVAMGGAVFGVGICEVATAIKPRPQLGDQANDWVKP